MSVITIVSPSLSSAPLRQLRARLGRPLTVQRLGASHITAVNRVKPEPSNGAADFFDKEAEKL